MTANQTWGKRSVVQTFQSSNTVDLAVLGDPGMAIKVTNLSGSAPIYFTVSRPGGDCALPTVGGSSDFCAASVAGTSVQVRHDGQFGSVVQLISTGTPQYMVEVLGQHSTS